MKIIESKAKEILDYLTKKIGYECFNIYDGCPQVKKHGGKFSSLFFVDGRIVNLVRCVAYKNNKMQYCSILDNMLRRTRTGQRIASSGKKTFLPAYASLEQILIEMDLAEKII